MALFHYNLPCLFLYFPPVFLPTPPVLQVSAVRPRLPIVPFHWDYLCPLLNISRWGRLPGYCSLQELWWSTSSLCTGLSRFEQQILAVQTKHHTPYQDGRREVLSRKVSPLTSYSSVVKQPSQTPPMAHPLNYQRSYLVQPQQSTSQNTEDHIPSAAVQSTTHTNEEDLPPPPM